MSEIERIPFNGPNDCVIEWVLRQHWKFKNAPNIDYGFKTGAFTMKKYECGGRRCKHAEQTRQ